MPELDEKHWLLIDELFCFLISRAQAQGKHWKNEQTAAITSPAGLLGQDKDSNPEVLELISQSPRRLRPLEVGHANDRATKPGPADRE